jgi:hypothetical protein
MDGRLDMVDSSNWGGSWLDCLPFHPAFAGLWTEENASSGNALIQKPFVPVEAGRELPYFPKHSLIALRGDDLIICGSAGPAAAAASPASSPRSTRTVMTALDLAGLSRAWEATVLKKYQERKEGPPEQVDQGLTDEELWQVCNKVPARRLRATAALDFEPKSVVVNPTGRLVVVAGERDLCVAVLPRGSLGFVRPAGSMTEEAAEQGEPPVLELRSFRVGEFQHSTDMRHKVVKVEWHPAAEGGSTLCVLSSEGVFRWVRAKRDQQQQPRKDLSVLDPFSEHTI